MNWYNLTYFGKGVVLGVVFWLISAVLVAVRGLYLNFNLEKLKPSSFYVFNGVLGLFGVILVGVFLIVCFGIIGWLYGRVIGEQV